ncbi:MAG: class I SAM-dependent methyltransferase, partial [Blastocatellia bacterium]
MPDEYLMEDRKNWFKTSHERKVEKFYGHGAENYTDFHDSYLNFGLWDEGIADYIAAAENLVRQLGAFCGLNAQTRLLDVACGFGTQDIFLTRTFSPASIDGVDVTWPHVVQARTRAREAGFEDRVRFHHGTATKLEFPEDSFSHVLSIEGPVHFDTREKFMREAQRVLKPGGVIAMADYTLKRPPR